MKKNWLIYGAYGYSGELLSKEAKNRGLNPILSGRSKEKLISLSEELDLEYIPFELNDQSLLQTNLKDFDLVLNAAGPFKYTSKPLVDACTKSGTNYLDITGEVPIFEDNFKYDQKAIEKNIVIISGVGFDVIPTDCMANYISKKISNPTNLEIGVAGLTSLSRGTLKTMMEYLPEGTLVRRNGQLQKKSRGKFLHKIRFFDKERKVMPITWGDLATAYKTTGIPNITTYMPQPKDLNKIINLNKSNKNSESNKSNSNSLTNSIEKKVYGPNEKSRLMGYSHIWVRASNDLGEEAESWLVTIEPYRFTSISGIKCVEKIFEINPKGALTPSLAFGMDFILEFPDTHRYDSLNQ